MNDFLTAFRLTNANEGGYSADPNDAGGETYQGISRRYFPNWEGWPTVDLYKPLHQGAMIKDDSLDSMVEGFYRENFWNKVGGDNLDNQDLANQCYDTAVNMGVGEALKLLGQS